MKRVLVTGASGFIGYHCLPALVRQGYEVHAVSSRPRHAREDKILWHQQDLTKLEEIDLLVENISPTHLLHLAWYVAPSSWATSGSEDNMRWVQASLGLLKAFQRCGGQRAVLAGSCTEYDWSYGFCSEKRTPTVAATFYGTCKSNLGKLLRSYSEEVGLSSVWCRIFFLYGPHEDPRRLVPSVIKALLSGEPALCSHGDQIRDYLYVQDVADALLHLLGKDVQGALNIGSGQPIRLKEIIAKIASKLQSEDKVHLGAIPAAITDTPFVLADIGRLRDEGGWRPKVDLNEGLDRTIRWWKGQIHGTKIEERT